MKDHNFFAELKRRNVYKVAVAYAVVAWLLIQVATQVFPFFDIPNWVVRLIVLLIILGFPIALLISWAFELTPEGLKRTEDVSPNDSKPRWSARKFTVVMMAIAILAGGLLLFRLRSTSSTGSPASVAAASGKVDRGPALREPEQR